MELVNVAYIKNPTIRNTSAIAQSAAEVPVLGCVVPASYLGTFTSIGFRLTFQISTTAVVGPTLTIKIKFGSAVLTVVSSGLAAGLVNKTFRVEGSISNQSATNTQTVWGQMLQPSSGIFGVLTSNVLESSASDWSIDTTTDQTAQVTVQFGTASASNSIRMIGGTMSFG